MEAASAALAAVAAGAHQAQPALKPPVAAAVAAETTGADPGRKSNRAQHMQDADGPATASQLWYLHLLLNTDTRTPKYQRLSKTQAAKMITELKAKKPSGTRSA